ncbi:protein of unknown function [Methanococcoides vulcani]|uniref:Anti-bacteriophage protein A/HamA C-terminal domain-containing protein n=1 Tax=Methanococcoides vulcani TaxID=1353158 RepID=A0A1I0B7X3_9EURY|nr:DUF1837 domain-containing protein [Methanococcoides vulcani]SET02246.1 protein of unknown function [Methanococcoides vulcani]
MLPKKEIGQDFLNLFYHELVDFDLEHQNKLNLFILKIANNRFAYDELINELYDNIITFSLSRHELDSFKNSHGGKKFIAARDKFRDYTSNEGELGEVLLYCFLESHLEAPKILTKLEIKTANNDYVKGADGVHLLKLNSSDFQLIFGESKLDSDLKNGIYDAFKSIMKFLDYKKNKVRFETNLINSQLIKESVDDSTYDFLKKIIIPSANEDEYNIDKSFGIFLGFDIKVDDDKKNLSNAEFRRYLRETTKNSVLSSVKTIKKQIEKKELWGYTFYLYIVPFTELKEIRKDIIEKLTT